VNPFSIDRIPRIIFRCGSLYQLPEIAQQYGSHVLFVTGAHSFSQSEHWQSLRQSFEAKGISYDHFTVAGEPSPQLIDQCVQDFSDIHIDVVIGIGGGSALDAAKAIAGLLRIGDSVMDYLEGVGPEKTYKGPSVAFIAVPTTAGTGSEATKNAVLSQHGLDGFKKSFRDDRLVAEYAIIDPDLLTTCPKSIIAANGMDALTQLIESYVSLKSNPFTDALARSGIKAAAAALVPWYQAASNESSSQQQSLQQSLQQQQMAYAALQSGICLAQVGLGSVHGLASPVGAFFPIPHGVVCGSLLAKATEVNIEAMLAREVDNIALAKYAEVAEIICQQSFPSHEQAWSALVTQLQHWTELLELPRLRNYQISVENIDHIVAHSRGSSMKTNPIVLSDQEIGAILEARI